jgi:hypothetical protein
MLIDPAPVVATDEVPPPQPSSLTPDVAVATSSTSVAITTTVQPTEKFCIVLCRLYGWSQARKYQTENIDDNAAARERVVSDLTQDGFILA